MHEKLNITICPSCGGKNIKKVRRNLQGKYQGQTYTVPSLEFYECPDCHEKIYDQQAMRKIEDHSPAYAKSRKSKESNVLAK
jgi:YgiT-type zinc finger domain-containing protein